MIDDLASGQAVLQGEGLLCKESSWLGCLTRLARLGKLREVADPLYAFVARNFGLDEGLLADRVESYRKASCIADHEGIDTWKLAHEKYLEAQVFLPCDDYGPPSRIDPTYPEEIPETFRSLDSSSPFLESDLGLYLVRVEEIEFLADKTGESASRIRDLAQGVTDRVAKPRDEQILNELLTTWHENIDQRPVYAGFWEDLKDLFEPRLESDWADRLRDRLGLAHLDPSERGVDGIGVLMLRYRVEAVPQFRNRNETRPLVAPTVLDIKFNGVFCPSPRGGTSGHVVNLGPEGGKLRREVLHPRPHFRASHVYQVGSVRRAVDLANVPDNRGLHLLAIREADGRQDYAQGTDWDLFQ